MIASLETQQFKEISLNNEVATRHAGAAMAAALASQNQGGVIYLQGRLGAGKTTFCQGLIQALGYSGRIKSPTYTLVESYELGGITVYHFDLYRLGEPEELEFLGIRDYFQSGNISLIEWPERGIGYLALADIVVELQADVGSRILQINAASDLGVKIMRDFSF